MGNPPPEVIWFKGHQVDPLSPLSRMHGGQYTVIAKNSVGAVNQTVGIEILCKRFHIQNVLHYDI